MNLFDYQKSAVENIRSAYRSGKRSPILLMPTGAGKTATATYIANEGSKRGNRILFVAHRQELVQQLSCGLSEWGVNHGVILPSAKHTDHPIQVASAQTLVRRLPLDRSGRYKFDLVVVDECHHVTPGTTWGKILDHNPNAFYLGLTATPCRLDGKGLGKNQNGYFDHIVQGPTVLDLIERGRLARPVIYAPPVNNQVDLSGVKISKGDYNISQLADAMDKPGLTGDAVTHYQKYANGLPAIAFTVTIEHAEHVAEIFRKAGYQAAALSGKTPAIKRKQLISDLGTGKLQILASCNVISEGTDVPIVAAAILLRPTASYSLAMQQIGRALRAYPGKDKAIILDHAGNTIKHGMPTDDVDWSLDGKPKKSKSKQAESPVKQCLQCYAMLPAASKQCPECGHVFEVAEQELPTAVDIELKEIDAVAVARQRKREQGQCETMRDLIELGRKRGYKSPEKWARHVYSARQRRAA